MRQQVWTGESLSSVTIQMSCLFVSETGVSAIVELSKQVERPELCCSNIPLVSVFYVRYVVLMGGGNTLSFVTLVGTFLICL